jgi:hypothetical protein
LPPASYGNAGCPTRRYGDDSDVDAWRPIRCSVCKQPVSLQPGRGHRRAALIEDGLTLCDVCAPSGNQQPVRFET